MQSTRKLIRAETDGSATTRKKTVCKFETMLKTCVLALLHLGLGVPVKKENRIFHFFTFCLLVKNAKFRSNLFCETMKNFRETRNAKISQKKIVVNISWKNGEFKKKKMQNFCEHYLKRLNTSLKPKEKNFEKCEIFENVVFAIFRFVFAFFASFIFTKKFAKYERKFSNYFYKTLCSL